MNECPHARQRRHAQEAAYCCGRIPDQPMFAEFGALFEDDNVYHVEILNEWPGPTVKVSIGSLPVERYPCLTLERAELRAAAIMGITISEELPE